MSIRRTLLTLAAPAALLFTGACATNFRADVARFQRMPPPQGQTFFVEATDPRMRGGIEFAQYAQLVAARMAAQGYQPAARAEDASLIVMMDYGVDNGHEKVVSTPGFGPWGGYGYGGGFGGFGPWGYGGFGGFGGFGRRGYYYGWGGDPFWYGGSDVESYTYYVSHLDLRIRNRNGSVLFEGKAKARSVDDRLPHLVPNLVEAMFVGFPGRSGEDLLITIPPPGKEGPATARPRDRNAPGAMAPSAPATGAAPITS